MGPKRFRLLQGVSPCHRIGDGNMIAIQLIRRLLPVIVSFTQDLMDHGVFGLRQRETIKAGELGV